VDRLEPAAAAPGSAVTALGANLGRSRVLELILINEDQSSLTHIFEQTDALIRFRVPRSLRPGRYGVELVTANQWGTGVMEQEPALTVLPE
jgi:hypothetical protein